MNIWWTSTFDMPLHQCTNKKGPKSGASPDPPQGLPTSVVPLPGSYILSPPPRRSRSGRWNPLSCGILVWPPPQCTTKTEPHAAWQWQNTQWQPHYRLTQWWNACVHLCLEAGSCEPRGRQARNIRSQAVLMTPPSAPSPWQWCSLRQQPIKQARGPQQRVNAPNPCCEEHT